MQATNKKNFTFIRKHIISENIEILYVFLNYNGFSINVLLYHVYVFYNHIYTYVCIYTYTYHIHIWLYFVSIAMINIQ